MITGFVAKFMGTAQKQWSESVQRRISDTTTVLGSMKETKMLGLVDSWRLAITDLLENQVHKSYMFRSLFVVMNVAGKRSQIFQ